METTFNNPGEEMKKHWEKEHKRGKLLGGLFLIILGGLLLGREFGLEIPYWIFSWKTFLVGLGIYLGLKSGFQKAFWLFPFFIGAGFLLSDLYPELINPRMLWPVVLIIIGLIIMLKPNNGRKKWQRFQQWNEEKKNGKSQATEPRPDLNQCRNETQDFAESTMEFTAFMGGISKNVISKSFSKGEINAIWGGAEINFSHADIVDTAHLEINAIMGGVKIIVPSHWEIKSEINSIMGGVDEKRRGNLPEPGSTKVLVLEGNVFLGGIEIKSY